MDMTPYMKCTDCDFDTKTEYFMLEHDLWSKVNNGRRQGFLCIGCVEVRLGRELNAFDFLDAPVNQPEVVHPRNRAVQRSDRLMARLANFPKSDDDSNKSTT